VATVLIVDHMPVIRKLCCSILRKHGYDVVEAEDGRQAVEKYRSFQPDAVLMDIPTSEQDGLTALQAIQQLDGRARIGLITAGSQTEVEQAMAAGARDFVLKPFNQMGILRSVQKLLRSFV
jgi:two-component system, chemotaxis family, chemotaxis protein CheY